MKISSKGLELIKEFEGMRLEAYKCPAGVWTIGIGHTGKVDGKAICKGMKITKAKATKLLQDDVIEFEKNVEKYNSKYNWNQNQFDALVSFAFNIGSIDQLTAGGTRTIAEISNKILAYNKAGFNTLAGLTRRRKAEKKLFDTAENTIKTTEKVAFRSKMEVTADNRICWIPKGTKVVLLKEVDNKWLKVQYNNKTGYVVRSKTNLN